MSDSPIQKVLFIGFVWPEPNSSAAGSRSLELIRLFRQQNWEVVFASAAALSEHRADLSTLDVREQLIALNCDSFDQFISEYQPQLVVFDRYFTEEQFGWRVERVCPEALRIIDTQDLHSLRDARHQLLTSAQQDCRNDLDRHRINPPSHSPEQLRALMATQDMAQREIAAIYRCDLSLMISTFEIDLLQQQFSVPPELLHHCHLMMAHATVEDALPTFEERNHFISIGNFRHAPNWDSVLWLKHDIWPRIRAQLPDVQLHIYGAYPPPKAMQLHKSSEGFHVLGWAEDALQVMQQARICLAPLRFGAGIKGKLADAMAAGTPNITTSIGAESMSGGLAWCGEIHDDAQLFANAAVALFLDENKWNLAQKNGLNILRKYLNKEETKQALIHRIVDSYTRRKALRQANFVGTMLRHQLHKSTQYMSQWIAVKTQLQAHQLSPK